jgi:hypothetical protein
MGCAWFKEDPTAPYAERMPEATSFFPSIIESNLAPPHCWLTPVDAVRKAGGFNAEMQWFEDWDLWWRVGLLEPELVGVRHLGALYRRHPGSQLAVAKLADCARGHAVLMARMGAAFLERPDLLERYGSRLFWSCVTALDRARSQGVAWSELASLVTVLSRLARLGPPAIRTTRLARSMRAVGVRASTTIHGLMSARAG